MGTTAYSADVYISYAGNDEGDAYENSRDEPVIHLWNDTSHLHLSDGLNTPRTLISAEVAL